MNSYNTDVVICGGGISGLLMAKSLLHLGLRVACIEINKGGKQKNKIHDLRSTALLHPAVDFFKDIGIWQNFENQAQPLNSLVICNLNPKIGEIDSEVFQEFFRAFSQSAKMTIHIENNYGSNAHHIIESCFKVLGICLKNSLSVIHQNRDVIPSTKGII